MAWTLATAMKSGNATTLSFTTAATTNYLFVNTLFSSGSTTITVSGGNVTTWNYFGATAALTQSSGFSFRLAYGKVTSTGAGTITVASTAGSVQVVFAVELTPPGGTTSVAVDGTQGVNSGASTTITWASQVPSGATDAFWGMAVPAANGVIGSTSGFTYLLDTTSQCIGIYSLAAPNPSAPTAGASTASWDAIDGLLIPSSGAAGLPLRPLVASQARNRLASF